MFSAAMRKRSYRYRTANLMEGSLRRAKLRLVQAWIEIHHEELMADWELAVNGQQLFRIDPLK
jgi:TnpA family transposase